LDFAQNINSKFIPTVNRKKQQILAFNQKLEAIQIRKCS